MIDQTAAKYLLKHPEHKNPKSIAKLFSYRQPVTNAVVKYLELLGLDKKPPPAKSLDEILNEDDNGSPDDNGVAK